MAYARELPLPPDPLEIGRRLAHLPGLSILHAASRTPALYARHSYVAACPDRSVCGIDPAAGAADELEGAPLHRRAPRYVGVIPYEACRTLERIGWGRPSEDRPAPCLEEAVWWRYPAVIAIDHATGRVTAIGDDRASVGALVTGLVERAAPAEPDESVELIDPELPGRHVERVVAALELIRAGDLYQVNLCRRLALRIRRRGARSDTPSLAFYRRLIRAAPTPFGALLALPGGAWVASTSPELLLDVEPIGGGEGAWLRTAPIKGTRPRGHDARSDRRLARELDRDAKERAELTMIIDVERNDLGRVAAIGSVRLASPPRVVTHRTVHHREAWLVARASQSATRAEILGAMVPSGSVTGAPKVRAMEVIARLEPVRRGLYTGGLGFVARDGSVRLSMAIRTCVFREAEGEYLTGGGIVARSNPAAELEETVWKSEQLRRVLAAP